MKRGGESPLWWSVETFVTRKCWAPRPTSFTQHSDRTRRRESKKMSIQQQQQLTTNPLLFYFIIFQHTRRKIVRNERAPSMEESWTGWKDSFRLPEFSPHNFLLLCRFGCFPIFPSTYLLNQSQMYLSFVVKREQQDQKKKLFEILHIWLLNFQIDKNELNIFTQIWFRLDIFFYSLRRVCGVVSVLFSILFLKRRRIGRNPSARHLINRLHLAISRRTYRLSSYWSENKSTDGLDRHPWQNIFDIIWIRIFRILFFILFMIREKITFYFSSRCVCIYRDE